MGQSKKGMYDEQLFNRQTRLSANPCSPLAPPAIVQSSETKTRVDAIEELDQGIVSILAGPSSVDGQ